MGAIANIVITKKRSHIQKRWTMPTLQETPIFQPDDIAQKTDSNFQARTNDTVV